MHKEKKENMSIIIKSIEYYYMLNITYKGDEHKADWFEHTSDIRKNKIVVDNYIQ